MSPVRDVSLPRERLGRLEFLIGEHVGSLVLHRPNATLYPFTFVWNGAREACERWLTAEFFAQVPDHGTEVGRLMLSFRADEDRHEAWIFLCSQPNPVVTHGGWHGDALVLVSRPTDTPWGLERFRHTFRPLESGGFRLIIERQEPDGWRPYVEGEMRPSEPFAQIVANTRPVRPVE